MDQREPGMSRRDILLLLAVAVVWGINFAVIKTGLRSVPPLFLVFLRYLFVIFPLVFFVKRPSVSWRAMAAYGLSIGVGQFSLLFYSIRIGMPAGLASVVMQSQAIFTLVLSAMFMRERVGGTRISGMGLAIVGLGLIGGFFGTEATAVPPAAFLTSLLAAFFWSCANIIVKRASDESARNGKPLNMMEMLVWSSIFVPLPMLCISLVGDGPDAILQSLTQIDATAVFSVLYLVILSTLFAYYLWNRMIGIYSAGRVAPFSLLVPVTGLLSAMLIHGERVTSSQWAGIAAVLAGLAVFQFGERLPGASRFGKNR